MDTYLIKRDSLCGNQGTDDGEELLKECMGRLVRLQGSDAGFFLLATHSFIESFLRRRYGCHSIDFKFPDLVYQFRKEVEENARTYIKEISVLNELNRRQETANGVRHSFAKVDREEAVAAAYRFIQFCSLAGLGHYEELALLNESLKVWEDRRCNWEMMQELAATGFNLLKTQRDNKRLMSELDELRAGRAELSHYNSRIALLENEINNLKNGREKKDGRIDELRRKKHELECEKKRKDDRIKELEGVNEYLNNLSRITNYTRTRIEYEQNITRLTKEQQRVLDVISLKKDYLIKGGAGTGKTLVLIKALEKAVSSFRDELDFSGGRPDIRLLTYSTTLARYDRYIALVMENRDEAEMISTVDKFISDKLRLLNPDYCVSYDQKLIENLVSGLNAADFFSDMEMANEIEGFLFANFIGYDDYVLKPVGRTGMKKPLNTAQRVQVWAARDEVFARMKETGIFSRNAARCAVLEHLKKEPDDPAFRAHDFIFIDEVQDLAAADIMVIKACTKRSVIMAGDSDQSIYQPGFTFSSADVDIRGTTKILRTNFRNSVEIHRLAENYRMKSGRLDPDTQPEAFRTGPVPELYRGADKQELLSLMMQRIRLFTEDLCYDPENICILLPGNKDVEAMKELLSAGGYNSCNLKNPDFSFGERNVIRLSTFHSSKGLDFPIVLMLLHRLPFSGNLYDEESTDKMWRNLIYVSITRAMDHVNVFTLEGENKPPIADLVRSFDGMLDGM